MGHRFWIRVLVAFLAKSRLMNNVAKFRKGVVETSWIRQIANLVHHCQVHGSSIWTFRMKMKPLISVTDPWVKTNLDVWSFSKLNAKSFLPNDANWRKTWLCVNVATGKFATRNLDLYLANPDVIWNVVKPVRKKLVYKKSSEENNR